MAPQKFYGFHTFAELGYPVSLNGVFRDNIRDFLQQCAVPEDYSMERMPVWRTCLVYESKGIVLPLFTVEEDVTLSENPFCDFCRCVGWSHNFVSRRKYHLIIPADEDWNKPLDENAFDIRTHLLHGLIHCNGFGHLLCINGIEGGSKCIRGRELMDLWDRICTTLHTRRISVEDLSKKHTMDMRLLHAVAYGHSWFQSWGYRFCHGSFGVKKHDYERAVGILSNLEINQVIKEFNCLNEQTHVNQIIQDYRDKSSTNLLTIRDLFRFLLSLKAKSPTEQTSAPFSIPSSSGRKTTFTVPIKRCSLRFSTGRAVRISSLIDKEKCRTLRKFSNVAARMESRWPVHRLEHVAEVIVEALKEKRAEKGACSCGMTRQEARDAARLHIGDTGLIDHVLKSLNNVIIGNHVVRRALNESSKILEYTIEDLNKGAPVVRFIHMKELTGYLGKNIYDDVSYLYSNILLNYPGCDLVKAAVQTILHSKHFVKDWPFRHEDDHCLRFICRLTRGSLELLDEIPDEFLPREYVVVPQHATVGDLKIAVQNAMRDTYCVMEQLFVTDVVGMEGEEDEEELLGMVQSGSELWVRGFGLDLKGDLRCEGGAEKWTVQCMCGAHDDDGERMVSCDICGMWQHTLCAGIEDAEEVPRFFICGACCGSLAPSANIQYGFEFDGRYLDPMMEPYLDPMMEPYEPELDGGFLLCQ